MYCEALAQKLVAQLKQKNWRITFAESCTGGLAAGELVEVSGASDVFDGSFVTYANSAKEQLLQVEHKAVEAFGVVSETVAMQMAQGACRRMNAQVGVGISGIAGPTGGTKEKPVGMVCFGFCVGERCFAVTKQFGNIGRNLVRQESVKFVYATLLSALEQI